VPAESIHPERSRTAGITLPYSQELDSYVTVYRLVYRFCANKQ